MYNVVMRGHLAVIVTGAFLLPATAAPQALPGSAPVPGISVQWNSPPPVTQPPPLPPAPQPGTAPWHHQNSGPTASIGDQFLADAHTYAPRYDVSSRYSRGRQRFSRGYAPIIGGYIPSVAPTIPVAPGQPSGVEPEGRLYLRVTPGSSRVFVDGLYVGVVDDFDGQGLVLEAGPRRIVLRMEGYETVTFDVRIVAGEPVTYRRELERLSAPSAPPRVTAAPKTFFVIPGCYAGDTPPRAEQLPKGCRAANLRAIPPVIAAAAR